MSYLLICFSNDSDDFSYENGHYTQIEGLKIPKPDDKDIYTNNSKEMV